MTTTVTPMERLTEIFLYVVPDLSGEVAPESRLGQDLDIDSLSVVEILVQVEKRFDITLEDEEVTQVDTVQDILDLIQSRQ